MKTKIGLSEGKIMASVFGDSYENIFVDYVKKEKTINSEFNANLLQQLSNKMKERWPNLVKKKVIFH